ncbi:MAG: DUF4352 domain-containing protein, partial [Chloroflexi bacterium]|nr:DUF4352 domain-containing protein [Chloroflexota bacterium]
LESQELEAGDRVSGAINYIVPESAIIDEVLYQPSSGGRVITLVDQVPEVGPPLDTDVPYSDPAGALAGLVTVRAIEDPFTGFREDSPPGVGLRYVQLNVAFEAAEDKPFEAHPSHIVLQDTEGFLWAYASISRPPDAKPQDLESQELEAGDRVSGAINYIVPESAIIDEVLYQPSSGGRVITLVDLSVTRSAPSPSETSAPPSPTADLLVVSLIQEQDLPRDLTAQDVSEPPAFDIDDAAFTAHGGSRAVSRTWQSDVGSIRALFDFRLEFPTTEDAIAYLDAAEPILSEAVASGLSLVEDPQPIGEDARHYSGEVEAEGQTIQFENYLFRVGPVVQGVHRRHRHARGCRGTLRADRRGTNAHLQVTGRPSIAGPMIPSGCPFGAPTRCGRAATDQSVMGFGDASRRTGPSTHRSASSRKSTTVRMGRHSERRQVTSGHSRTGLRT